MKYVILLFYLMVVTKLLRLKLNQINPNMEEVWLNGLTLKLVKN